MAKRTKASLSLPTGVQKSIELLAQDIVTARKRRGIPQRLMAERMMVSLDTVQRLEKGDPGVSLAVVATALWVLGLSNRLELLAAPREDTVGTAVAVKSLPKRVRTKTASKTEKPDLDF